MADYLAVLVALIAFALSLQQAIGTARTERLRLLLGQRETVAFRADQIADGRTLFVSKSTIRALLMAALLEPSDRARLQIYRALDALGGRHRRQVCVYRASLAKAARLYEDRTRIVGRPKVALKLENLDLRLGQLDAALPWIAPQPGVTTKEAAH